MDEIQAFTLWLWANKWHMIALTLLVVYGKRVAKTVWQIFVLQPIQGRDKNTSMRELAQYALVVMLVYMVVTDTPPFSYEKMGVIVIGVAAIAGAQIFNNLKPPTGTGGVAG